MRPLALFTLLAASARGAAPSISDLLKGVEARYNSAQTLEVKFTETYSAQSRGRRSESGVLSLRKPGRMRWDYTSPKGKLFVSDGKFFYLYTPSTNRVQKSKGKETEDMRAPLSFLLGKLDFWRDFRKFEARVEGQDTWIAADPKSPDLIYTKVEFLVSPAHQIRRVRVTGQDHSVLDFIFDGEKMNPKLDARLFEFQMPPGAAMEEIPGQPAR
ncbi:MAG: LolA family protein [Bryobacteraceae bacterium]